LLPVSCPRPQVEGFDIDKRNATTIDPHAVFCFLAQAQYYDAHVSFPDGNTGRNGVNGTENS
jgi:hypothetical protein